MTRINIAPYSISAANEADLWTGKAARFNRLPHFRQTVIAPRPLSDYLPTIGATAAAIGACALGVVVVLGVYLI